MIAANLAKLIYRAMPIMFTMYLFTDLHI